MKEGTTASLAQTEHCSPRIIALPFRAAPCIQPKRSKYGPCMGMQTPSCRPSLTVMLTLAPAEVFAESWSIIDSAPVALSDSVVREAAEAVRKVQADHVRAVQQAADHWGATLGPDGSWLVLAPSATGGAVLAKRNTSNGASRSAAAGKARLERRRSA
eukprot:CAMPEP_0179118090 /NCGR_PEP_ID=MMETSP0796-20121207/55510_1 /TAXON_ID=73915 /ORGANISM="Pyrodinium bahamense, Strain pbaha01" /LENGTH=157 /DNA_ID=CAMNT_0020816509 /DNA_START=114 /DNA_END=585 /DNA_ORIENTATION=-